MDRSPEQLESIKRLTISALVSDETLMGILVLKGGNALNIGYDVSNRGSIDIDYSIAGDFSEEELNRVKSQIGSILETEFASHDLHVFDVKFENKPEVVHKEVEDFWGGYALEFKVIEQDRIAEFEGDIAKMQGKSIPVGKKGSTVFKVDISKYEYVGRKVKREIDGAIVQVYSPEMIVIEKMRALCQQFKEYSDIVMTRTLRSRSRDFYDIVNVLEHFSIDIYSDENIELFKHVFDAKRVPYEYLSRIEEYREFHRDQWQGVADTVEGLSEEDYDAYFDKVKEIGIKAVDLIR